MYRSHNVYLSIFATTLIFSPHSAFADESPSAAPLVSISDIAKIGTDIATGNIPGLISDVIKILPSNIHLGPGSTSSGTLTAAIGNKASSDGTLTLALGNKVSTKGVATIAAGSEDNASGLLTSAIGIKNNAGGLLTSALGISNTSSGVATLCPWYE
ncbi:hypothetical protein [Hafnia paralvei]|uniref:hypothetical protein n=1 Tax=Hafnia paralvei TaxID=546367 RepID=UPI003C3C46FD